MAGERDSSIWTSGQWGLFAAAPVLAAAVAGSIATTPNIKPWYALLTKPSFTPPNWVFGPAWTLLYILMAYAFWRILVIARGTEGRRPAIVAFLAQLALNALWSFVFFGWHAIGGGLAVVGVLWIAIAFTMARFWPLDRTAALFLAPYLAWTSFAVALNAGVWLLNP